MSNVTIPTNSNNIYEMLNDKVIHIDDLTPYQTHNKVKLFINGNWYGITDKPYELFLFLKDKKYSGIINIYTSIIFDYKNAIVVLKVVD